MGTIDTGICIVIDSCTLTQRGPIAGVKPAQTLYFAWSLSGCSVSLPNPIEASSLATVCFLCCSAVSLQTKGLATRDVRAGVRFLSERERPGAQDHHASRLLSVAGVGGLPTACNGQRPATWCGTAGRVALTGRGAPAQLPGEEGQAPASSSVPAFTGLLVSPLCVAQPPPAGVLDAAVEGAVKTVYFIRHGQSTANAERVKMQVKKYPQGTAPQAPCVAFEGDMGAHHRVCGFRRRPVSRSTLRSSTRT